MHTLTLKHAILQRGKVNLLLQINNPTDVSGNPDEQCWQGGWWQNAIRHPSTPTTLIPHQSSMFGPQEEREISTEETLGLVFAGNGPSRPQSSPSLVRHDVDPITRTGPSKSNLPLWVCLNTL
jgi:hypothetical protein